MVACVDGHRVYCGDTGGAHFRSRTDAVVVVVLCRIGQVARNSTLVEAPGFHCSVDGQGEVAVAGPDMAAFDVDHSDPCEADVVQPFASLRSTLEALAVVAGSIHRTVGRDGAAATAEAVAGDNWSGQRSSFGQCCRSFSRCSITLH